MVCLVKSKYKKELKEYADILGSEEAAYYVIAANNGYTLDYTPQGKVSTLYSALLEESGDPKQAVLDKARAYLPSFLQEYGDWITNNKPEPSFGRVLNKTNDYSTSLLAQAFPEYIKWYTDAIKTLEDNNIKLREFTIEDMVNISRSTYIRNAIELFLSENQDATDNEIYNKKMQIRKEWDNEKMSKLVVAQQEKFAESFGLKKVVNEDGSFYYSSSDTSEKAKLRVFFVNSLREGEWKGEDGIIHKGMFVNKNGKDAIMNLIYISMHDGDITTLTHELAHYYVRLFWNSKPIQDALFALDDKKSNGRRLEEKLVDELVSRVLLNEKKGKTLWKKLSDLASELLHKDISRVARENALDACAAYFSINADLKDLLAERVLYHSWGDIAYQSKYINEDLPQMLSEVFNKIKNGVEVRLKSLRSELLKDNAAIAEHERKKQQLSRLDEQSSSDVILAIRSTVESALGELLDATYVLNSIKQNGIETLNPKQFLKIKTDVIEYYRQVLLGTSLNILREYGELSDLAEGSTLANVIDGKISPIITSLERVYDGILYDYCSYIVDYYADELVDVGNKDVWKVNAKRHLRNDIRHGRIMPLEVWIGPASQSYSPIVRLVEYLNTEVNAKIYQDVYRVGAVLFDLFEKASVGTNWSIKDFFLNFIETDENGNPNGYFVSEREIGNMRIKQRQMEERLMAKYNVVREYNERGIAIGFKFPDPESKIKFLDEHDLEMDKISNRRYKAEYYIQRRRYLSEDTIEALRFILKQIDLLVSQCTDSKTGLPNFAKLTREQLLQLNQLIKDKDSLSSFYIIELDSSGKIIKFLKKQEGTDEYRMALELQRWSAVSTPHIKYIPNYDRYSHDLNLIRQNMSPLAVLLFEWYYSSKMINPDVYTGIKTAPDLEIAELIQRRKSIIDLIKPKKGYYVPRLELLNDDALNELRAIDERLYFLRSDDSDSKGVEKTNSEFKRIARIVPGTDKTYIDYFRERYSELDFYDKFYYTTYIEVDGEKVAKGIKLMSMFYDFAPVVDLESNIPAIINAPIGIYTTVDKTSDWANPNYIETNSEPVQPNDQFISEKWKMLHDGKHNAMLLFFEALVKTKKNYDAQIPYIDVNRTTKIPAMTERSLLLFLRKPSFRELWTRVKGYFRNEWTINDRDVDYNEERLTRPDGSKVDTIPLRWLESKDPSTITTDILGSVLAYAEMAATYNARQNLAPLAEMLALLLHGGISAQTGEVDSTDQFKRLRKYIDMYIYGKMHSGFGSDSMGNGQKILAKLAGNVAKLSHLKTMAHNWRTVLKNAVDSARALFVEVLSGKYISWKDLVFSTKECGSEFFYSTSTNSYFSVARSMNTPKNISKVAAAMAYNKQSGSIYDLFSKHNENTIRRWIENNFAMGEYTLVDYTAKGWITVSIYHHIRRVPIPIKEGENIRFVDKMVNEDLAAAAYQRAGLSEIDGRKNWSKSKFTLWDCYYVDDYGVFTLDKNYKDLVRPKRADGTESRKIETLVMGSIREVSAIINGILPEENKAGMSLNWAAQLLLLLRGWLITHSIDAFKVGDDFKVFKDEKQEGERQYQRYLRVLGLSDLVENDDDDYLHGLFSFLKGTVDHGWLIGLRRAFKSLLTSAKKLEKLGKQRTTSFQKYQLRKFSTYIACSLVMIAMTYLTGRWVEKDPNSLLKNFVYSANLASVPESITLLSPATLKDLVQNPTAAYSYIEDFDSSFLLLGDASLLALNIFDIIDDLKYNEIVKTGSYQHLTKGERTALKASSIIIPGLGINNIYKNVAIPGQRAYQRWNQKVFPNNLVSYKTKFNVGRPSKNKSKLDLNLDLGLDLDLDLNLDLDY